MAFIAREHGHLQQALGTTKLSYWPFVESLGVLVTGITAGTDLIPSETSAAAEALEDDFSPLDHRNGVHSYHFNAVGDHHLAGGDHADYSHGNGTVDSAASWFAWILPTDIATTSIMAKYDSAGNLEEWKWGIDGSGQLELELHDASASASEIGASTSVLEYGIWQFVCTTYAGTETAPVVTHYISDGSALPTDAGDGTTTESGAYVAMENTAAPLTIGCAGVSALPTEEFTGRIAFPGMTGKALTAVEVEGVYRITKRLLGL